MSIRSDSGAVRPSFAIAGATGRVGAELTRLLAEDPVELLALTRCPEAAVLPAGVRAVGVDFERPASLPATLQGVERLFIAQGSSPNQVANEIALIDAAVAAGVRHVVKLSAMGPATRLYPMAWHMPIEAHLARQPIASTVLRPSAFTSLLLRAGPLVAAGGWGGAVGSGRTNFVDTRDVAAAARAALFEEVDGESQLAYHLTGPRAWTVDEIARELSGLLDRPVAYAQRSLAEQHALLLAGGLSPFVADLLVGLDRLMRASGIGETTRTVEELTGRPPRSLTDWLRENLDRFRRPAA
ncbi:NAD(P)H-binding protein [Burkholderia gladioli]|uniref:NAD(P)-dependent oxidoreductase n=2 Tax=Burkholderia gladioli TaxID=28095 RepID=A0A2A7S0H8_BURGA|nr:NAD(P)H-binding protein [Burkholderia gladioli]MBJ9662868.1 NAD(P)H-binding protein [Burkholderia gladioli]MBU9171415.1 NAD(P)H-binding protein [Burkholderia gladioli]MBU9199263.1 NAD(P)H-binding protein [Burkholderia gladioli]MBU9218289.1 NAD(P)H-binding protein [Burkholderia gladioli]MBU9423256.1 NAD(P)H-binding protein [Burkholderia gladioli]